MIFQHDPADRPEFDIVEQFFEELADPTRVESDEAIARIYTSDIAARQQSSTRSERLRRKSEASGLANHADSTTPYAMSAGDSQMEPFPSDYDVATTSTSTVSFLPQGSSESAFYAAPRKTHHVAGSATSIHDVTRVRPRNLAPEEFRRQRPGEQPRRPNASMSSLVAYGATVPSTLPPVRESQDSELTGNMLCPIPESHADTHTNTHADEGSDAAYAAPSDYYSIPESHGLRPPPDPCTYSIPDAHTEVAAYGEPIRRRKMRRYPVLDAPNALAHTLPRFDSNDSTDSIFTLDRLSSQDSRSELVNVLAGAYAIRPTPYEDLSAHPTGIAVTAAPRKAAQRQMLAPNATLTAAPSQTGDVIYNGIPGGDSNDDGPALNAGLYAVPTKRANKAKATAPRKTIAQCRMSAQDATLTVALHVPVPASIVASSTTAPEPSEPSSGAPLRSSPFYSINSARDTAAPRELANRAASTAPHELFAGDGQMEPFPSDYDTATTNGVSFLPQRRVTVDAEAIGQWVTPTTRVSQL